MEKVWTVEIDKILSVGCWLETFGTRNWALTKRDALDALDKLALLEVGVLGGDVHIASNGKIEHNYDSWYCDCLAGELKDEFSQRSISVARTYISKYRIGDDSILFSIVPD